MTTDLNQNENGPDEKIHIHGWCALFCEEREDNPHGGSTEHPSFCRSTLRGGINMMTTEASQPVKVWMTLIKPYFTGWVNRQWFLKGNGDNTPLVQMEIQSYAGKFDVDLSQPDHPTLCLKMTAGEARATAAHLTWFADNADRLVGNLYSRGS